MNSPSTPFHNEPVVESAGNESMVATAAGAGSSERAGILRTPTEQGTDTTNCPPPPWRRDRTRARRRVSFAPNA